MRDVTVTVEGITPYSSSAPVGIDKLKDETHEEHEIKIWREKVHVDPDGRVFIPGAAFKMSIDEAAAIVNEKVKGKGNQTYTKILATGIIAIDDMNLGIAKDDLKFIKLFMNADGRRGSGTRVWRWFPYITSWKGTVTFRVVNDAMQTADFERFFVHAGLLAGVGRGRPAMKCPAGNGRFRPVKFEWKDVV